jgi:hypothetical protein
LTRYSLKDGYQGDIEILEGREEDYILICAGGRLKYVTDGDWEAHKQQRAYERKHNHCEERKGMND